MTPRKLARQPLWAGKQPGSKQWDWRKAAKIFMMAHSLSETKVEKPVLLRTVIVIGLIFRPSLFSCTCEAPERYLDRKKCDIISNPPYQNMIFFQRKIKAQAEGNVRPPIRFAFFLTAISSNQIFFRCTDVGRQTGRHDREIVYLDNGKETNV